VRGDWPQRRWQDLVVQCALPRLPAHKWTRDLRWTRPPPPQDVPNRPRWYRAHLSEPRPVPAYDGARLSAPGPPYTDAWQRRARRSLPRPDEERRAAKSRVLSEPPGLAQPQRRRRSAARNAAFRHAETRRSRPRACSTAQAAPARRAGGRDECERDARYGCS